MKTQNKPTFTEELAYWSLGINHVIGLDEVGRGAFAGPIVAAGVVFKPHLKLDFLSKVNDSKLLSPKVREELSIFIKENSVWDIASLDLDFINTYGIGKANNKVLINVLNNLLVKLNSNKYYVLVDGFDLKIPNQKAIIKGDQKCLSIAAASIIAKVYRDNLMKEYHKLYPNYALNKNMGYGTKLHRDALKIYGSSKLHRSIFVKNFI
jgi:ribonuclease HII